MINSIKPQDVHSIIRRHMQADGFDLVLDTKKSLGSRLVDAKTGRAYLDFYSFFGSAPIGMNHPKLRTPEFQEGLIEAATNNPANADVYTTIMADFVSTFSAFGIPSYLPHLFLIAGGALAVENTLKTAFDWKVRKRFPEGFKSQEEEWRYVNDLKVIFFDQAFHGRSGYTLTMTNTYYRQKTQYFPRLDWIKAPNPKILFPLNEESRKDVEKREAESLNFIESQIEANKDKIAALIIEPIQAEGGDNHFRPEFHRALRKLCDDHEIMMIYDEVQTGVGLTGTFWAHEKIGVKPDCIAFGKKMQVCGVLAGKRVDEAKDNVFAMSGRINSTWGGNLANMYRATWYLRIIRDEKYIENAAAQGEYLVGTLHDLAKSNKGISNVRGSGLMCAFDMTDNAKRDAMIKKSYEKGLLILKCGEKTVRLRPALNITRPEIDEAGRLMKEALKEVTA